MKKLLLISVFILCTNPIQAGLFSSIFGTSLSAQEKLKDDQFSRQLNRLSIGNACGNLLFNGGLILIGGHFGDRILQDAEPLSNVARSLFNNGLSARHAGAASGIILHLAANVNMINHNRIPASITGDLHHTMTSVATLTGLLHDIYITPPLIRMLDYGAKGITALPAHNTRNFIRKELPSPSKREQTARLRRWQEAVEKEKAKCWTNSCEKQMNKIAAFLDKTDRKNK